MWIYTNAGTRDAKDVKPDERLRQVEELGKGLGGKVGPALRNEADGR